MFSSRCISKLERTENVVVFTGAGISAESGVPTFRSDDGIWKKFKPEELANADAFIRNPELVWEWYKQRKIVMATVEPNAGHRALVEMEKRHEQFTVVTQNIDNLHRRAGSRRVHELHGNIERNYCIECRTPFTNEEVLSTAGAPKCGSCGGLVRPDVVWFGEMLPEDAWRKSLEATEEADIFFSIGTSAIVYPAASLLTVAKRAGAYLVEINVEQTEQSMIADEIVIGKSGELLPRLLQSYHRLSVHTV